MKLINGPYNGREIADSGACTIRMALSSNGNTPGAKLGEAIYEPSDDRTQAYWSGNNWLGTLEETVDA